MVGIPASQRGTPNLFFRGIRQSFHEKWGHNDNNAQETQQPLHH
jgi:hypothetical protein